MSASSPSSPSSPPPSSPSSSPPAAGPPAQPSPARRFKDAAYAELAEVGKALASPARLEIVELLAQAPRSVERLAVGLGQSVANTSHHLQALKRAHLVRARREGLHVVYALAGDDVAQLLVHLHAVAAQRSAELDRLSCAFFDDPAGLEPIDRDTLRERLRLGEVVLLDVRPAQEFAAGHLPGARSAPLAELEAMFASPASAEGPSPVEGLPRDRTIVAYCRGPFCALSAEAARRLRALGYDARRTDVSVHSFGADGPSA